ncbi:MAG: hypothetical protein ABIN20_03390 [candidate division WOR-3 bacterium]
MLFNKKIVLVFLIFGYLSAQDISKEYLKEKKTDTFKEDFFLLKLHRITGYTALISGLTNAALGATILYGYYNEGKLPPQGLRYTHKVFGYLTFSLYLTNGLTGSYSYFKLINKKEGRKKRTIHMILSLTSASLMGYGAYMAYSARTKPDYNLYYTHRNLMLLSFGVILLSVGTIIW